MKSLGLEIEMPVACQNACDSRRAKGYFARLKAIKEKQGLTPTPETSQGQTLALSTPGLVSGVDNAFNNLESALGPICASSSALHELHDMAMGELRDVEEALAGDDAMVVNFSEHPDVEITPEFYHAIRSPKSIYGYWVDYRGWNHMVGVDAKAHNGPTTGVNVRNAISSLNILLGAGAAFIALFSNSPFEAGKPAGNKENRLTIWPNMFATSKFPCDRELCCIPKRPFKDLRDYFSWFFGPGTNMQFVVCAKQKDYKKPSEIVIVDGDPPMVEYLAKPTWPGRFLSTGEKTTISPSMEQVAFLQFTPFIDARLRFGLNDEEFPHQLFLDALKGKSDMDALCEEKFAFCYIEGRAAGANFPDQEILDIGDGNIARSMVIGPSAIQTGLLRNREAGRRFLESYAWADLLGLRAAAIKDGLEGEYNGIPVKKICGEVLDIAADGLDSAEEWMLEYARFTLASGKSGADRALDFYESGATSGRERLKELIRARRMRLPLTLF